MQYDKRFRFFYHIDFENMIKKKTNAPPSAHMTNCNKTANKVHIHTYTVEFVLIPPLHFFLLLTRGVFKASEQKSSVIRSTQPIEEF